MLDFWLALTYTGRCLKQLSAEGSINLMNGRAAVSKCRPFVCLWQRLSSFRSLKFAWRTNWKWIFYYPPAISRPLIKPEPSFIWKMTFPLESANALLPLCELWCWDAMLSNTVDARLSLDCRKPAHHMTAHPEPSQTAIHSAYALSYSSPHENRKLRDLTTSDNRDEGRDRGPKGERLSALSHYFQSLIKGIRSP